MPPGSFILAEAQQAYLYVDASLLARRIFHAHNTRTIAINTDPPK